MNNTEHDPRDREADQLLTLREERQRELESLRQLVYGPTDIEWETPAVVRPEWAQNGVTVRRASVLGGELFAVLMEIPRPNYVGEPHRQLSVWLQFEDGARRRWPSWGEVYSAMQEMLPVGYIYQMAIMRVEDQIIDVPEYSDNALVCVEQIGRMGLRGQTNGERP